MQEFVQSHLMEKMKIPKFIAIFLLGKFQSWSDGSSHALEINHASLPEKRRYYILRGSSLYSWNIHDFIKRQLYEFMGNTTCEL